MKILYASSEIFPYAKTGGLADVSYSLPKALKEYVIISRVMPMYGFMNRDDFIYHSSFTIYLGNNKYDIKVYKDNKKVTTYFILAPFLSETLSLYGDDRGDYKNNALRFAIFSKAIVHLALSLNIDILHLNDWHTSLAALYLNDLNNPIKTVLTIHNLAYQGIFSSHLLKTLGIDEKYFTINAVEFYSKINFLKAGIAFSNIITTVSPQYEKDILTKEFGMGLDGFLRVYKNKLIGILNGIDKKIFNPKSDKYIYYNYSIKNFKNKKKNKKALIKKLNFKETLKPLFIFISRLVEQKGVDLLLNSLNEILNEYINLLIIGEGDKNICNKFREFEKKYSNFYLFCGYDETFSHKAYAGADFLLMPSNFEPCGLNQLIAMTYGTIVIAHSVGGLKDTVFENEKKCGIGFVYEKQKKDEFLKAIKRALSLSKKEKKEIAKFNMNCDFSFKKSALKYFNLYKDLL